MASRPRPRARMTDAESREARGYANRDLTDRLGNEDNVDVFIQKTLTRPTLEAHQRTRRRFTDYLTVVEAELPGFLEKSGHADIEAVLTPGAPVIKMKMAKGFIDYIAEVAQGRFDDNMTVDSLINQIGLFIGMYSRAINSKLPDGFAQQLFRYARADCKVRYSLSTKKRERRVADATDVRLLQMQLWSEDDPIPSTRMRRQLSTYLELASSSASRPGNIVESSCYSKSEEALLYEDTQHFIIPGVSNDSGSRAPLTNEEAVDNFDRGHWSPFAGKEPQLVTKVRYNLLKGRRKDDGEFTEFVYKCEPLSEIGSCIVSNLLFFALEDGAFKAVKSLDDLEKLMRGATGPIRLSYEDVILRKAILRSYNPHQVERTSTSSSWTVSETRALTYNSLYNLLVKLGFRAGLEHRLLPYDLRRMGANRIEESGVATSEQRRQIMGHDTLSKMFSRYQSALVNLDLSAIVHERDQCLEAVKSVGRLSIGADKNAPIALSPEGLKKIMQLEEVQAALIRQDQAKAKCISAHGYSLTDSRNTPEGMTYRHTYAAARTIIRRHSAHAFQEERKRWFNSQDQRMMDDIKRRATREGKDGLTVADGVIILPDADQEEHLENLDIRERYEALGNINMNQLTGGQCGQILESGAVEHLVGSLADKLPSTTGQSFSAAGSSGKAASSTIPLATLTVTTRRVSVDFDSTIHYPPSLAKTLFGGLHDDGSLSARFKAWRMLWSIPPYKVIPKTTYKSSYYGGEGPTADMKCKNEDCKEDLKTMTPSQRAIHVHQCETNRRQDLANTQLQQTYPYPQQCDWGSFCNRSFTLDEYADCCAHMRSHIARAFDHGGTCKLGESCQPFSTNEDAQQHLLEDHMMSITHVGFLRFCYFCHSWFSDADDWARHLAHHFSEWFEPTREATNLIEYNAIVNTGIVFKPGLCPFCLWDVFGECHGLDQRFHQFASSQKVSVHIIKSHHDDLITHKDPLDCPCGRCPSGGFSLIELYNHLIESHSIPMAGMRHKKTSSGALPTLHSLDDLAQQPTKRKSRGVGAYSPAPPPSAPTSPSSQAKPGKKAKMQSVARSSKLKENDQH